MRGRRLELGGARSSAKSGGSAGGRWDSNARGADDEFMMPALTLVPVYGGFYHPEFEICMRKHHFRQVGGTIARAHAF